MTRKNVTEVVLADANGIAKAAAILERGGLVAVPTETVYGLAARADSAEAVAKIYAAKGRPSFNPLIVHVADLEQAELFTDLDRIVANWSGRFGINPSLRQFASSNWPGTTTLVVPARREAPAAPAVTAGLSTIALRMPKHRVARELIKQVGPIAAPSANRSGFVSPTTAAHVLTSLDGRIDLVLDAGPTEEGVESTILGLEPDGRWRQLRAGPTDTDLWHPNWFVRPEEEPVIEVITSPGQLASHYSPGKPMRLNVTEVAPDDFMIGFGAVSGDCTLSEVGDLAEAASKLYDCLHQAAASDKPSIAVAPVPEEGVGGAINDRLRRAATPPT